MELNKGVSKNNSRMKTVQAYFCENETRCNKKKRLRLG